MITPAWSEKRSFVTKYYHNTDAKFRRISWLFAITFFSLSIWWFWPIRRPPFPTSFPPTNRHKCPATNATHVPKIPRARDFLPLHEAQALCTAHNLPMYPHRDRPRKVYDLIPLNTELDWLEIRLNELSSHVDHFVILESFQTFTGYEKPMYFRENVNCFFNFLPKIIYHALNLTGKDWMSQGKLRWGREHYSRNALLTEVFPSLLPPFAANQDDVLIVADIDEIPRPETIEVLRNCQFPKRTTLRSRFFYYSFQWQHRGKEWQHPQATYFDGLNTVMPENLRSQWKHSDYFDMWNASWHCSSCFETVSEMVNKIASFSHQEFNRERYRAPGEIVRRVRNGIDLFDRWRQTYDRVEPVVDVPGFLKVKENAEKYKFILDRDPVNANFADYTVS